MLQLVAIVGHLKLVMPQYPWTLVHLLLVVAEVLRFFPHHVQLFRENSSFLFPFLFSLEGDSIQLVFQVGTPFQALLVIEIQR